MEHLGKQEKYLFGLDRSIEKAVRYQKYREIAYITPASNKGGRLIAVSFIQEPNKIISHRIKHRTRRSK